MRRASLAKLLIVLVTGAVCGGLLWWQAQARVGASPASSGGTLVVAPGAVPTAGAGRTVLLDPAALKGTVVDEEAAKVLFRGVREGGRQIYDPVAYAVLSPGVTATWKWPEHPDGQIVSRTNNLGFREDGDTQVEKQGARILVAGDSHTDGMVNNDESFSNVLEARLNSRPGSVSCEVLNAGVGATGPQNYVGTLKRNLYLQPDVFIAVLFTGNDFLNALAVSDFFSKRKRDQPTGVVAEYQRLIMEADKRWGAGVVDRFNQPLKFAPFPADAEIALQASIDSFREMAQICAERHIEFLAVILPTKPDVDTDDRKTYLDLLAAIGISEAQFGINAQLGARLAEALRAQGIRVLDSTEALRADVGTSHYWVKDWHLNVAGHALVAGLLHEVVEPLLRH